MNKSLEQELLLRLDDERKELVHAQAQLLSKVKTIEEARQQLDTGHALIAALPQVLPDLSREEQEKLIMALISRIDVAGNNEVAITLRLDPMVIRSLSQTSLPVASSHQHEFQPGDGSQKEPMDKTSGEGVNIRQEVNVDRCKHRMGYSHS